MPTEETGETRIRTDV